ncbi:ganglioside GM2 activator [Octopus bimaculoides]|uniref:MD-2-related lipid-recognition domain-containing protein n=1 Tax=Octopus bimaculoides TaxID=37653 RepID=A0A0L8FK70_OCTBM|nr:ganglioside GM2 activator [Octopus bimaculoides]|eukprot:XP_014789285.1 PREDICTED: ganglioside GM2 activator-like [Octopus bimaculoides]
MNLLLLLSLVGFCLADNVLRYKPYHPARNNQEVFRTWIMKAGNLDLKSFKWSDCGNSSSTLKVKELTVGPDPLVLPGTVTIGFELDVAEDFDDGLSGSVEIYKKVESTFIRIPCIGNIGSCEYKDVCGLMAQIPQCPQPFIDNKIPCKCPFKKNSYKMPSSNIDIPGDPIPSGDYKATVHLKHNDAFAGCLQVSLTLT